MIRVNPFHWTADFRLARGLAEAYNSSGYSDVCFLCLGDPDDVIGQLGPLVGDETIKYYPNVLGTSDKPVTPETFEERVDELLERWPDAFVIGIEAGYGPANLLGSIEITDRDLTTLPQQAGRVNDITVNVLLRVDESVSLRRQPRRRLRTRPTWTKRPRRSAAMSRRKGRLLAGKSLSRFCRIRLTNIECGNWPIR